MRTHCKGAGAIDCGKVITDRPVSLDGVRVQFDSFIASPFICVGKNFSFSCIGGPMSDRVSPKEAS